MKAQTARTGFPAALLTFSVMLLVLALGFVVGRVVVARAYLGAAPTIEAQGPGGSELDENRSAPGHIYVPTPSASQPPADESRERERPAQEQAQEQAPEAPQPPEGARSADQERQPRETEAPPVQQPQPAEETAAKTYAIQVGVFTSLQGARQVVDELARAGYPSRIAPDKRGAQELYRVLTGRYRSEYAARKALDQLRTEGFEAFLMEQ
jgi:cell division protein FtsN